MKPALFCLGVILGAALGVTAALVDQAARLTSALARLEGARALASSYGRTAAVQAGSLLNCRAELESLREIAKYEAMTGKPMEAR